MTKKEQFLKDPDMYRDVLYEMRKRGRDKGTLKQVVEAMGLKENTIEHWGYRSKQMQVPHLPRALEFGLRLDDDALAHFVAELFGGRFIKEGAWQELRNHLNGVCRQFEEMD